MKAMNIKTLLIFVLLLFGVYQWQQIEPDSSLTPTLDPSAQELIDHTSTGDQLLRKAFENRQSDIQVRGRGRVVKLLPDDNQGSRHQRFIIKLDSGQTVLVAHNIDLAPKVDSLARGDYVEFYGEYEWNEKGGVIHWTHHDPKSYHIDGWLKHNDRLYQ
ncbi:DUF3465 domain-containing protein [Thalassotalea aquiviva]|uniref:DUF3465 domain-containing protein n=1 Tax=Thalassotalea aquiviva TaxID=3242415 RepID=UPI00352A0203